MGLFYDIIMKQGYYEVLINGKYYCSADDLIDAANKVTNYYNTEEKSA